MTKNKTTIARLNILSLHELIAVCRQNNIGISYNSMTQKIEGIVQ